MSDPKRPLENPMAPVGHSADARGAAAPSYEAPSLIEVGTLRDLTAAGSFGDPT